MATKFRVGSVPYLNARPLVAFLEKLSVAARIELSYAVPSLLAEQLESGILDAANVSIFELFRQPNLFLLPGMSISAYGPVESVRLFYKPPLASVQKIALDSSSLTSVALLKILLKNLGISPQYISHSPDLPSMLQNADAALLIGASNPGCVHKWQSRQLLPGETKV